MFSKHRNGASGHQSVLITKLPLHCIYRCILPLLRGKQESTPLPFRYAKQIEFPGPPLRSTMFSGQIHPSLGCAPWPARNFFLPRMRRAIRKRLVNNSLGPGAPKSFDRFHENGQKIDWRSFSRPSWAMFLLFFDNELTFDFVSVAGTHEVPARLSVQSTEHSVYDESLAPERVRGEQMLELSILPSSTFSFRVPAALPVFPLVHASSVSLSNLRPDPRPFALTLSLSPIPSLSLALRFCSVLRSL